MSVAKVDYSKGKIYVVFVKDKPEKIYIGSTTWILKKRLYHHRDQAKSVNQTKCASSELFENNNEVVIELIEDFPCASKRELEVRERYWIEFHKDRCINKNIPTRDWKERWYDNHQHNLQRQNKYKAEHREELSQAKKEKYASLTQEEKDAKNKADYERRKEKVAETRNAIIECPKCKEQMTNRKYNEKHKKICNI